MEPHQKHLKYRAYTLISFLFLWSALGYGQHDYKTGSLPTNVHKQPARTDCPESFAKFAKEWSKRGSSKERTEKNELGCGNFNNASGLSYSAGENSWGRPQNSVSPHRLEQFLSQNELTGAGLPEGFLNSCPQISNLNDEDKIVVINAYYDFLMRARMEVAQIYSELVSIKQVLAGRRPDSMNSPHQNTLTELPESRQWQEELKNCPDSPDAFEQMLENAKHAVDKLIALKESEDQMHKEWSEFNHDWSKLNNSSSSIDFWRDYAKKYGLDATGPNDPQSFSGRSKFYEVAMKHFEEQRKKHDENTKQLEQLRHLILESAPWIQGSAFKDQVPWNEPHKIEDFIKNPKKASALIKLGLINQLAQDRDHLHNRLREIKDSFRRIQNGSMSMEDYDKTIAQMPPSIYEIGVEKDGDPNERQKGSILYHRAKASGKPKNELNDALQADRSFSHHLCVLGLDQQKREISRLWKNFAFDVGLTVATFGLGEVVALSRTAVAARNAAAAAQQAAAFAVKTSEIAIKAERAAAHATNLERLSKLSTALKAPRLAVAAIIGVDVYFAGAATHNSISQCLDAAEGKAQYIRQEPIGAQPKARCSSELRSTTVMEYQSCVSDVAFNALALIPLIPSGIQQVRMTRQFFEKKPRISAPIKRGPHHLSTPELPPPPARQYTKIPKSSLGAERSSMPGRIIEVKLPDGTEAILIRTKPGEFMNSPEDLSHILDMYRAKGGDMFPKNLGLYEVEGEGVFLAVEKLSGKSLQNTVSGFHKQFDEEAVPKIMERLGISRGEAQQLADYAYIQPDGSVRLRFDQIRHENSRLFSALSKSGSIHGNSVLFRNKAERIHTTPEVLNTAASAKPTSGATASEDLAQKIFDQSSGKIRANIYSASSHHHLRAGDMIIDPTIEQFFRASDKPPVTFVGTKENMIDYLEELRLKRGFNPDLVGPEIKSGQDLYNKLFAPATLSRNVNELRHAAQNVDTLKPPVQTPTTPAIPVAQHAQWKAGKLEVSTVGTNTEFKITFPDGQWGYFELDRARNGMAYVSIKKSSGAPKGFYQYAFDELVPSDIKVIKGSLVEDNAAAVAAGKIPPAAKVKGWDAYYKPGTNDVYKVRAGQPPPYDFLIKFQ